MFPHVDLESMDANLVGADIGGGIFARCGSPDMALLRDPGTKPIHLFFINPAWSGVHGMCGHRAPEMALARFRGVA